MHSTSRLIQIAFALIAVCVTCRSAFGHLPDNPLVIHSDDGHATLTLARAVPSGVSIRVVRLPDDSDPAEAVGSHYRVEPMSLHLSAPARLMITSDSSGYPGGATASDLMVMRERDRQWIAISQDTRGAMITDGGDFAVRWQTHERCTGVRTHALDFRIGIWDYRAKGYDPGRTTVTRDGSACALRESYVDVKGGRSASLFIFNTRDSLWHVTTYDPGGRSAMSGQIEADGVAFYHSPADREVYRRLTDSTAVFIGERSTDGGKSWAPWATATYTRAAEPARRPEERD